MTTTSSIIKTVAALLAAGAISLAASTAGYAHGSSNGGSHSGPITTSQPNHGPGSSHNPIVYHPVHGPGSSHNPILATQPVVRDHRNPGDHRGGGFNGGSPGSSEGGVTVTNGRTIVPTKLGDYPVYTVNCSGLCNGGGPTPIIHDHR
jgi:hypothetical protein